MSIYQPAFALTDALIDEAGRRGLELRSPSMHICPDGSASITMHASMAGDICLALDAMSIPHQWYYLVTKRVCESRKTQLVDVTGRQWWITVIREVGPVTACAHLLPADDEDGEVAA